MNGKVYASDVGSVLLKALLEDRVHVVITVTGAGHTDYRLVVDDPSDGVVEARRPPPDRSWLRDKGRGHV